MLLFASLSSLEKKPKQKSEKYRLRINHYFRLHELHLEMSELGPSDLDRTVNPISTKGMTLPTALILPPPPRFSDLPTALNGCM